MYKCPRCGGTMSRGAKQCRACSNSRRIIRQSTKDKIRAAKLGSNNPNWSGNEVSYRGLHQWVQRHYNKPEFCEQCKVKPPLDLANKSGEYKRDLSDWEYLCRSCHMRKDGRLAQAVKNLNGNECKLKGQRCHIFTVLSVVKEQLIQNVVTRTECGPVQMDGI